MKIELHNIKVSDVFSGYVNSDEDGVVAFGGKLNVRPKYQREFIYKDDQRDAVIDTIRKGFPLNVMYWAVNNDSTFEVLDGQQRTISICEYLNNMFSVINDGNRQKFFNLTESEKKHILDYELMVYFCEGDDKEKLEWFKTINIAGVKLSEQELRNAVYTGPWLTDAKKYFSKTNCPAQGLAGKYLSGAVNRQEYLETALGWISKGDITGYMADHQNEQNANELWLYFRSVIDWVELTFPKYRSEMKGLNWGKMFDQYNAIQYNTDELELEIIELMMDEDVTKKSGIYEYVLTCDEKCLSIRSFTDNMKREAYERQKGKCIHCKKQFDINEMEADHITPWSDGGKTVAENCQMLCRDCNRRKSNK